MNRGFLVDAAVAIAVLVVVTLLAELLGATNLGTALTFGQIALVGAVVFVVLRRP